MEHSQASETIFERALALLSGPPAKRHVAQWEHCSDVVASLESLAPIDVPPFPPALDCRSLGELQGALTAAQHSDDDAMSVSRAVAETFVAYRNDVLNVEAKNARSLTILCGVLRILDQLDATAQQASDAQVCELVAAMRRHVEQHIAVRWRTAFPPNASPRDWPILVTRRYDALPVAWRYLGPGDARRRRDAGKREGA
jgi:hypothetical protein